MARNGKISGLARDIREELNRRLGDGERGPTALEWLNALPEVQETLAAQYEGVPISSQNLSDWRQGGYQDWVRHQESCDFVEQLDEQTTDLREITEGENLSDWVASVLAVEVARTARQIAVEITDPQERWLRLKDLLQELHQLRREDHRAAQHYVEMERADRERAKLEKQDREDEIEEAKQKVLAPVLASMRADLIQPKFGMDLAGEKIAKFLMEFIYDLKKGSLPLRPEDYDEEEEEEQAEEGKDANAEKTKEDGPKDPGASPSK